MTKELGRWGKLKDTIIIIVFLVVAAAHIVIHCIQNGFTSMDELFGQLILILLGFVGLLEIFHYVGWDTFVPNFMLNREKEERLKELQQCMDQVARQSMDQIARESVDYAAKQCMDQVARQSIDAITRKSMETYFEKEVNFLKDYSEQRIEFVMSQLGINAEQFEKIRLELIKMRCLPLKNLGDAERKVKQYIGCGNPMVVDLTNIDPAKRTYKCVDYYLNFNDAMYIDDGCREFAQVMHLLICEKVGIDKFDRIVIPYDSNVILGVEVGKLVGKPVVKMRSSDGRVEREQRWDGNFCTNDRLLIVHDVLVSGSQIIHVQKNVPTSCSVVGLCCLAVRTEGEGLKMMEEKDIPVSRVVDLCDQDIAELIQP